MTKQEFLADLKKELKKMDVIDIDDILEYYDEYIEEQKELGKKEKDIIKKFDMNEIMKEAKIHMQINTASEKPTLSNGIKALIAFLGVLSFPMLIVAGAVLFAIIITVLALIFSFIVTIGAIIFGSGVGIVAFIVAVVTGQITISSFLFVTGVSLVVLGLFLFLMKWAISISRDSISWLADTLQSKLYKRRGGRSNE